MLGNIGDLFVKCMQQVTKGHLFFGALDYNVTYRPSQFFQEGPVSFVKCLQSSPIRFLIPLDGSKIFCEKSFG